MAYKAVLPDVMRTVDLVLTADQSPSGPDKITIKVLKSRAGDAVDKFYFYYPFREFSM